MQDSRSSETKDADKPQQATMGRVRITGGYQGQKDRSRAIARKAARARSAAELQAQPIVPVTKEEQRQNKNNRRNDRKRAARRLQELNRT